MKPERPKRGRGMGDFVVRKKTVVPAQTVTREPKHEAPALEPVTDIAADTKPKKKPSRRWKRFKAWFFEIWRPLLISVGVAGIVCLLLGFQIGSLTSGVSVPEQQYIASVKSGKELLSHPSFLVHRLPVYALFKLNVEQITYYRLISATFGAAAVLGGFLILRRWFSLRVSLLASWLLLSSSWLLHNARLATPEASFLLLMPLLWSAVWMYSTRHRIYSLIALLGISTLSLYIPGFVWLVLAAIVWQRKTIIKEFKAVKLWFKICAPLGLLIGLAPLVYGAIQNPSELLVLAGLPKTLPELSALGQNALSIPMQLLLQGPDDSLRWLGRIPLLDIASSALFALGIYGLRFHLKLMRTQLLIFLFIIFGLLITLGGPVTMLVLLPVIYLLIAGGIAFLLQQWFTVFPKNPIARSIGTTLVSVLALLISFYHINHYFIAWPQTPATKGNFGHSLLK